MLNLAENISVMTSESFDCHVTARRVQSESVFHVLQTDRSFFFQQKLFLAIFFRFLCVEFCVNLGGRKNHSRRCLPRTARDGTNQIHAGSWRVHVRRWRHQGTSCLISHVHIINSHLRVCGEAILDIALSWHTWQVFGQLLIATCYSLARSEW